MSSQSNIRDVVQFARFENALQLLPHIKIHSLLKHVADNL